MNIDNILVPFDFSDSAFNALAYASELAQNLDSKIHILHVYNLPLTRWEGAGEASRDYEKAKKYESSLSERFENFRNEVEELKNVNFDYHIQLGSLLDTIMNEIHKDHVDLVIMGTEGTENLENKILGSTTVDILRHSDTPVITIPHQKAFYKMDKIGLAVDFKEIADRRVFDPLIEIAKAFDAEIHIIHVFKEKRDMNDINVEEKATKLNEIFEDTKHSFHITGETEDVDEEIEKYIEENEIKMLAMLPHKHSFFKRLIKGSHTEYLALHGFIPVMALYENK